MHQCSCIVAKMFTCVHEWPEMEVNLVDLTMKGTYQVLVCVHNLSAFSRWLYILENSNVLLRSLWEGAHPPSLLLPSSATVGAH